MSSNSAVAQPTSLPGLRNAVRVLSGWMSLPRNLPRRAAAKMSSGSGFPRSKRVLRTCHPSESFDLAISEFGASIWCDPYVWIPEAHRLLRPRGRLWFLRNSTLSTLCSTDEGAVSETLQRPQRGLGRLEWPSEVGVEWQLPLGELIRLLRQTGFDIVDLVELYPPSNAVEHSYYITSSLEWARNWPCEEIWVVKKSTYAIAAFGQKHR